MEKIESILFAVTFVSFVGFLFFFFNIFSGSVSSVENFNYFTGNVIFGSDNFKVGDKLTGNVEIEDKDIYGILSLTEGKDEIITETFYVGDFAKGNILRIEDIVDYNFEKAGEYELFFSVLESNIKMRKKFVVD